MDSGSRLCLLTRGMKMPQYSLGNDTALAKALEVLSRQPFDIEQCSGSISMGSMVSAST